MVAYPLTTWIVLHFSWPVVFYVNAVLGFVWAAAWLRYATDTPGEHPRISQEERHYIESNLAPKPAVPLPLRAVFTAPPVFILSLSYMCFAYIGWMFLFSSPRLRQRQACGRLFVATLIGAGLCGAFAWWGGTERNDPYSYRVQGPTFLIEHNNTQSSANHIHSVWRDMRGDFGIAIK